MKKKALFFYVVVVVVAFFVTWNWLGEEPAVGNKGEMEMIQLYREYEEETNQTTTWDSISSKEELVEYEKGFKEWLEEKGE